MAFGVIHHVPKLMQSKAIKQLGNPSTEVTLQSFALMAIPAIREFLVGLDEERGADARWASFGSAWGLEAGVVLSLIRFIDGVLGQLALNDVTKVEQLVKVPFGDLVFL